MDISGLPPQQLLKLHAEIEDELRRQNILRTANNPTGDLAEYVFCMACKWKPADNSQTGYDAVGSDGSRYQIKGRRITQNKSRQMSAIRGLKQVHFDFLAGVLFNSDYSVKRAALIPHKVLLQLAEEQKHISFQTHTNSHRFLLVDKILDDYDDGMTDRLKKAWY